MADFPVVTATPRPLEVGATADAGIRIVEEQVISSYSPQESVAMDDLTANQSVICLIDHNKTGVAANGSAILSDYSNLKLFVVNHVPFSVVKVLEIADVFRTNCPSVSRVNDTHVLIGWLEGGVVPYRDGQNLYSTLIWHTALVRLNGALGTMGAKASLTVVQSGYDRFVSMCATSETHAIAFQYGNGAFAVLLDVSSLTVAFPPSAVPPFTVTEGGLGDTFPLGQNTNWAGNDFRDGGVIKVPDRAQLLTYDRITTSLFDVVDDKPRLLHEVYYPKDSSAWWYHGYWTSLGDNAFYASVMGPGEDDEGTVLKVVLNGNTITHEWNPRGATETRVLCRMGPDWFLGGDALYLGNWDLGLMRNKVTPSGNLAVPRRYEKTAIAGGRLIGRALPNNRALVFHHKNWADRNEPDPQGIVIIVEMFEE